jgi:beta-lactamase regulating signal transducer with metallopeptidase domain
MNGLFPAIVPSLGWALLDFVWQGLLVGWAAALLLALLAKARPQARYAVACAALLLCVALPLAGTVQRVVDAQQSAPTTMLPLPHTGAAGSAAQPAPVIALPVDRLTVWQQALQQRLPLVILCWSCGAALMALRMLLGLLWVRRRSRPGQYRTDAAWQARLDRLASNMGLARKVVLGLVDDLASPVTAGWWRPVVLVPASLLSGMSPDLLEALLAHELAHVRRFDYLVNLIQSAIEILLFYHPTVWWLSNRIRLEREQIADDVAASTLGEPRRLALALSELDLFQLSTPQLAHAAHGGNLMLRIKRLVRPESEQMNWKLALPILGLAACAALYTHTVSASQATPAHPAVKKVNFTNGASRDDAYALVRDTDHGTNMSGDSADWSEIEAVKRHVHGEFLWFRDGGKTWIVQDPGILARANKAWEPVDRLGKEMDAYGQQMDQHSKKMEALGHDMEQAAARFSPDAGKTREFERKMNELGERMGQLGARMADAGAPEREHLQAEMAVLGKEMHQLGEQFKAQQESGARRQARASMDEIGARMREASKPMNELGKKMGALGKEMERESKAADKAVRGLIREAREKGLAHPAA